MKIAILGSGKGTNARAILQHYQQQKFPIVSEIALFTDKRESSFLEIAREYRCHGTLIENSDPGARLLKKDEERWIKTLDEFDPSLIVLAGFMRIVSGSFIKKFNGQIINVHPSLLPSFKGRDAVRQAFDYGVKTTGCTVHWVEESVDGGRIIEQAPVRIYPNDDLSKLRSRIQSAEHQLLPKVIRSLAKT